MTTLHRFALVLHTHVPYVRRNGVWPAGEDLFHQAARDSYLPLIGMFDDLAARGLQKLCTVAVTPVAAHQMADAHMRRELAAFLARDDLRALRQVANYNDRDADRIKDLAAFYARFARRQARRLARDGGIDRSLARLSAGGVIELMGGPATHPLLPAIGSERLRALQIETGLDTHAAIFGPRPPGTWIPECAVAPGVDASLAARGVTYAVVDPAALPKPVPSRTHGGLLVFPRSIELTEPVWSPGAGYPAGANYRDFHHYDVVAGFKNWRVTDPAAPLADKQPYDPARAEAAARADAAAYVRLLEQHFRLTGASVAVAAFDTELFGHWWFEGPAWIRFLLERLSAHPTIRPSTLGEAARTVAGDAPAVTLRSSTWGIGSDERSWRSPRTESLFERLAAAEHRAAAHLDATGPLRDQMLRELLLAQSSDWPYMIVRDENAAYAWERFDGHLQRLEPLLRALEGGAPADPAPAFDIDNCFAALPAPASP